MDRDNPNPDGHPAGEATGCHSGERDEWEEETDPDVESWLLARQTDWEERSLVLADLFDEGWRA